MTTVVGSALDDFLDGAGAATETGERMQTAGLLGSIVGLTLAIGLVLFLILVHRGSRREIGLMLRVVGFAGMILAAGAALEVGGVASVANLGWAQTLTNRAGSAPMMRLIGGFLIVLGVFEHIVLRAQQREQATVQVIEAPDHGPVAASDTLVRWAPSSSSVFAFAGLTIGIFSFAFDGHTVTEGPRALHAVANTIHVSAGGVWFGGIVGLFIVAAIRRRVGSPSVDLIVRFSSVATIALIAVSIAGIIMSLLIIDGFSDFTSTEWGRLLLIKTAAVAVTVAIGGYNHFVVVPVLAEGHSDAMARRARLTIAAEAVLLFFVACVTAFLASASTN